MIFYLFALFFLSQNHDNLYVVQCVLKTFTDLWCADLSKYASLILAVLALE